MFLNILVKADLIITILLILVPLLSLIMCNDYHIAHAQQSDPQETSTYYTNGEISGLAGKFIIAGPWNLHVKGGVVDNFTANFTAVLPDGARLHYHTFSNFHQVPKSLSQLDGSNSGSIHGTMDVGFNNNLKEWPQVPTVISIKNGTTISVILNDASRVYPAPPIGPPTTAFAHFTDPLRIKVHEYNASTGSQPVYGVIKQLVRTYTIVH